MLEGKLTRYTCLIKNKNRGSLLTGPMTSTATGLDLGLEYSVGVCPVEQALRFIRKQLSALIMAVLPHCVHLPGM